MKSYILTLTGAILLSALVSALVPEGKMGKFLKGMTNLFVFSVVVVPLLSLFGKEEIPLGAGSVSLDGEYLKRCERTLSERDETEICALLQEEHGLCAKVSVQREEYGNFARKKILVQLEDLGITGEKEHIDMAESIRASLEEKYGCQTEVIWLGET